MAGLPNLFKWSCWGTKTFCQMVPGLKNFFNSSKIPSALVPGIKKDYSLNLYNIVNDCSLLHTSLLIWWKIIVLLVFHGYDTFIVLHCHYFLQKFLFFTTVALIFTLKQCCIYTIIIIVMLWPYSLLESSCSNTSFFEYAIDRIVFGNIIFLQLSIF